MTYQDRMDAPPQRFAAMDQGRARQECPTQGGTEFANCPACKMRVGLHCTTCKVQITGCLCTEQDRFGNDESWRRAVQRWGAEDAAERLKAAGLWVPDGY